MNIFNKKNLRWGVLLVVVLILIFLYQSQYVRSTVYSFMDKQLLIPRAETYTELYFTDPSTLPKKIKKGDNVSFAFTIHNVEVGTTTYPYKVFLVEDGATTTHALANGELTLARTERGTVAVQMLFAKTPGTSTVFVQLLGIEREIGFHVNK